MDLFPTHHLLASHLLLGDFLGLLLDLVRLGDNLLTLGQDDLNVAGGAHVR